jgi:two-component system cell cycle sensor histidine kinase PleC
MDFVAANTDSRRVRFFKGSAEQQAYRISWQIIGIALFVAVCMWSFIAWSVWSEYRVARATARTHEFNLTAAFAGELTLTFDSAAGALRLIQSEIAAMPPSASSGAIQARMAQVTRNMTDPARDILIVGPDGRLLFSTLRTDPAKPDPAATGAGEQPHFIRHRDDPTAGLIVGPAAAGLERMIAVSRRLEMADGRFAGEATLMLEPASLINLHHEIDLGPRGMVVVVGIDGLVLAGFDREHSDGSAAVGIDLRGAPYPDNLQPGSMVDYIRRGRVDDVERLITIRRLNAYPLNVLVGLDMNDVVSDARGPVLLTASVGAGTSMLIAALTLLLIREVWRRTTREIELAADRERLQLAQQQIDVERGRLAETNRELIASKERAEVANRTKSQFLAHMSHELRTPLHAIIGFSELIRDQAPANADSTPVAGYAADILTSGRHLLDLINTILDIAKIESGTTTLAESLFPLADLARNALVLVRAQADARQVTLDLNMPETAVRLFADRTRLLQVLINLLSNAVKFTPEAGRIVLSVAFDQAGNAILSVIDSGIGMTEAEIMVALEPFGQVDNALSRTFEGTGLGLPLAARLADLHGGKLELTSIKGRGTAVRVTLPAWRVGRRIAGTA